MMDLGAPASRRQRGESAQAALLAFFALFLIAHVSYGQDATPTAAAGPVRVTARVDPQQVTIGTPFRYTMRVEADQDVEVVVPILAGQLGELMITDFGEVPTRKENGHVTIERWYTLVTYDPGDHLVPGATIQYRAPGGDMQRVAPGTR